MKDIVFIGGIHGVGKGWTSKEIQKKININHYSSSSLIKMERKGILADEKIISENDSHNNQDFLLNAISKLSSQQLILDGHFCLLGENKEPLRIPEETFIHLHLKGIIVLEDELYKIQQRLLERDKASYNVSTLHWLQEEEKKYATEISQELDIPILVYNASSNQTQKIINFVDGIIGHS
ncbi:ATP-binding protein [Halobacillus salinarum]|uniref:ATP-binding protein n=1 Tax=Halobacillus salinarum TaxID=2932257 RepID=A0ABY4EIR5_9BACI|nr:ATP-binding protein [Halobacillus salinarum]UOQ43397.1 ATP-binding protein [Halobacillus salinarum]